MNYRPLGSTGIKVSEISLGTWQAGGKWGTEFDDANAEKIINTAIDLGINFIDTADVYSGGKSEAAAGRVIKSRREEIFLATKCGRQLSPHTSEQYTPEALTKFVEASLKNSGVETLDLIQLHCPPTEVYYRPEIFATFDKLKEQGKIRNLGVSVEKAEEALKAIEYPNVKTVQIIFNMFRHRPSELFFQEAVKRNIGIIVRVPLASGLLTGKFGKDTTFDKGDHRNFNRNGEAFDKGETFSGVDYETGLKAVNELEGMLPQGPGLAAQALQWILSFREVSTVIPGASRPEQIEQNVNAAKLPPMSPEEMTAVKGVYNKYFRFPVHFLW